MMKWLNAWEGHSFFFVVVGSNDATKRPLHGEKISDKMSENFN